MYIIIDVCLHIFMYTQGGHREERNREIERERERERGAERERWGCHLHLIKWDGATNHTNHAFVYIHIYSLSE